MGNDIRNLRETQKDPKRFHLLLIGAGESLSTEQVVPERARSETIHQQPEKQGLQPTQPHISGYSVAEKRLET